MPASIQKPPQAVVFDLDETLLDRTASVRLFAGQLWQQHQAGTHMAERAFVDEFLRLDGFGYTAKDKLYAAVAKLLDGVSAARVEALASEGIHSTATLFPGVLEGLQRLQSAGVPMGIVTNGGTYRQEQKIQRTGLHQYIDHWVISEHFGMKKPAIEIFQEICRRLDINPQHGYFVGDHPVLDICGANAAGLRTIWIERHLPWPQSQPYCADHHVTTFTGALEHLI